MKKNIIKLISLSMAMAMSVIPASAATLQDGGYILLVPKDENVAIDEERVSNDFDNDKYDVLIYDEGEDVMVDIGKGYDVRIFSAKDNHSFDDYVVSYMGTLVFQMPADDVYLQLTKKLSEPEESESETSEAESESDTIPESADGSADASPAPAEASSEAGTEESESVPAEEQTEAQTPETEIAEVATPVEPQVVFGADTAETQTETFAETPAEAQTETSSETPAEAQAEDPATEDTSMIHSVPSPDAVPEPEPTPDPEPVVVEEYVAIAGTVKVINESDDIVATMKAGKSETSVEGSGSVSTEAKVTEVHAIRNESSELYMTVYKNGIRVEDISEVISSAETPNGEIIAHIVSNLDKESGYTFVISSEKPGIPVSSKTLDVNGTEVKIVGVNKTGKSTAGTGLNIRTLPTATSPSIGSYRNGATVYVTGETETGDWLRVRFEKNDEWVDGYVRSTYVTLDAE